MVDFHTDTTAISTSQISRYERWRLKAGKTAVCRDTQRSAHSAETSILYPSLLEHAQKCNWKANKKITKSYQECAKTLPSYSKFISVVFCVKILAQFCRVHCQFGKFSFNPLILEFGISAQQEVSSQSVQPVVSTVAKRVSPSPPFDVCRGSYFHDNNVSLVLYSLSFVS